MRVEVQRTFLILSKVLSSSNMNSIDLISNLNDHFSVQRKLHKNALRE